MAETPYIFNIQKFSTHDGDGVRTTIFFKGCPLRCMWCHNPESQHYYKELIFHHHKCTACGRCVAKCKQGANSIVDGKIVFDRSKCTACGVCTDWCITEARELAGKEYTVDALVKEAMKDKIFYEQSGGGVTLSSGYTDYENLKRILPYVDVFLYDIKVMDPEDHKKYIGVDNSLILENLKKLSDEGAGLYIRLPIIQQVNATDEHIESVIHFLKENNIHARQVNLLPYHDIGKGKYASLDMEYHDDEMSVPVSELMEHFKSMFEEQGFNKVNIGG